MKIETSNTKTFSKEKNGIIIEQTYMLDDNGNISTDEDGNIYYGRILEVVNKYGDTSVLIEGEQFRVINKLLTEVAVDALRYLISEGNIRTGEGEQF
jgi:hypothetical protein